MSEDKHKLPISPIGPLSPEDRRVVDKIRLAKIEKHTRAHELALRQQDLDDLRRLEKLTKRDWTDNCFLHALRNKYGRADLRNAETIR